MPPFGVAARCASFGQELHVRQTSDDGNQWAGIAAEEISAGDLVVLRRVSALTEGRLRRAARRGDA